MTHKRIVPAVAAALLTLAAFVTLAACGSSGGSSGAGSSANPAPAKLTVFAASSLNKVFPQIATAFQTSNPGASFTFNFAGTDTLTTQIEQGAPADVFAGASAKYGDELSGKGLIAAPRIFATNRLVLIVPAADPAHISSLRDLTRPGVKLVVGDATVPIGTYTRKVLANLDATYGSGYSAAVLKNVVSNETEVTGVLSSVELGEADAGFVYVTDARNGGDEVRSIALPASAQAVASYPVAAVVSSKNAGAAGRFATFLLGAQAQAILRAAGFGPPEVTLDDGTVHTDATVRPETADAGSAVAPRRALFAGGSRRRAPFGFVPLAALAVVFLALPVVGLVVRAPWREIPADLTDPGVLAALRLSVLCSVSAVAVSCAIGVPLAWVLARVSFPGRALVRALVVLPMVLPPVVGGVALLLAFGRNGLAGQWLERAFGISLPFSTAGAVMAETFVAMPFLVITVEAGLRSLGQRYEDAASTLGAGRWTIFRRVTLPLIAPTLGAGAALCWARALGEFGATITFAGNLPGSTQTMPLAVYVALQNNVGGAMALSLVMLVVSLAVLVALRGYWFGGR